MPDRTQPQSRMRAVVLTVIIVIALVYLFSLYSRVWTDYLWFDSLGFRQVFTTQLVAQVGLFVVAGLIMGVAVAMNIWMTLKTKPVAAGTIPYHDLSGLVRKAVIIAPGVFFGILGGIGGVGAAHTYLAWKNKVPFGVEDAKFGLDISFYVFDYPWYRSCVSFFISMVVISAIIAVVGHFMNGSFFAPVGSRRVTSKGAHIHVGILLGLATLGYGLSKLLDRYGLLLTSQGLLDGLTYTSDHSRLPANVVLAVIAFLTAVLFFATAAARSWRIPLVSVGLVIVSSLVVGAAYPAFVQSFTVNPTEPDKEKPYMEMHIAATRQAYGIDDVEVSDYSAVTSAEAGQLRSDAEALPGIRLMDPQVIQDTFEQLQQVRGYYSFSPVLDVDRYVIDGSETDVVLAAREMDHSGLDSAIQNWNNLHTVYTHGYGLVATYGNRRQADGEPDWLARDIPTQGELSAEEPRIYYGEMTNTYAIVGREEGDSSIEYDTPGGGEEAGEQYNTYDGEGGVAIGSVWNRLLYAMRFGSINFLLSDRVNSESMILYDREPSRRVQEVAPWLTPDSDIYPAIVGGRIVWIVDCYTTSSNYPNSQRVTVSDAISDTLSTTGSDPYAYDPQINYIRNSVKAIVDAYDGTVTLYAWDESDPILQTWEKVFPESVQPKSAISDELMSHLRYPEDLFKIQRQILARYHMTSTESWYSQSDLWKVPTDPVNPTSTTKEPTYYLSIKWPETTVGGKTTPADATPLFSQTTVYTPNKRDNLAAYMSVVAEATSPQYGQIRILRMSDTNQIEGPGQAYNSMMSNESVSSVLLPYSSSTSAATTVKGNLLTIPLGGGLLYVEPIYTKQSNTDASFPILRFVVVRFGTHVGVATTLQGALDQVFSGDAGATTGEETGDEPDDPTVTNPDQTPVEVIQEALSEAATHFEDAQQALTNGDLAAYQEAIAAAQAAVERALEASNG